MKASAAKARSAPSVDDISGPEDIDLSKAKIVRRGARREPRYTLQLLRKAVGKTQADIAVAAGLQQADISRIEARDDRRVSTMARYAEALGGTLEVAIVIDGRRYVLE